MIAIIPTFKLQSLEKKVQHIRNKGANVIFNIVEENLKKEASNCPKVFADAVKVEIEGVYKINGWQFVATIQHTKNGNIIRCVNNSFEGKIPERYKTTKPICEHCHSERIRKDTYLIYNQKNGEFKQVGSTCLKDYTCGLDATICAEIASIFEVAFSNFDINTDDLLEILQDNTNKIGIAANTFKKVAFLIVKKEGYAKSLTIKRILKAIEEKAEQATNEQLAEVNDYVASVNTDLDYFYNASIAWQLENLQYRDMALVASLIASYFKNQSKIAEIKANEEKTKYIGSIGDKITIDIKNVRVLYTKDNSAYSYYADPSYVYEIIDTTNNTYIYSSSNADILHSKKLYGTVKGYKEFKGIKQTVITRCKILA